MMEVGHSGVSSVQFRLRNLLLALSFCFWTLAQPVVVCWLWLLSRFDIRYMLLIICRVLDVFWASSCFYQRFSESMWQKSFHAWRLLSKPLATNLRGFCMGMEQGCASPWAGACIELCTSLRMILFSWIQGRKHHIWYVWRFSNVKLTGLQFPSSFFCFWVVCCLCLHEISSLAKLLTDWVARRWLKDTE